jgi:hypothetical protein
VTHERIWPDESCVTPRTFSKRMFVASGVDTVLNSPMTWWSTRAPPTA